MIDRIAALDAMTALGERLGLDAYEVAVGINRIADTHMAHLIRRETIEKGFDQIIWTDSVNHKLIEEAGTMNIFFRINNKLITPEHTDTILDGVTRKSVITVAKDSGIDLDIRDIEVSEIIQEYENGNLTEVFGAGTAAVIAPISSFGYKEKKYILKDIDDAFGPIIKKKIVDIQNNLTEDKYNWRYQVI